jgi:outer membrane protein OmpA-like peptidoglycan-associated protein/Tol biopolymer transport system component
MKFGLIAFLFFSLSFYGLSQGFHTTSNRALKSYNEGLTSYDYLDYQKAENQFKEALKLDPKFFEAYMMLGELFLKQKRYPESADNYRQAVRIDSLFFKPVFYSLAVAEMMSGDYQNAKIHFQVYLDQKGMSEKNQLSARKNLRNCEFAFKAIKNPVSFNPVNAGAGINTSEDEYWPSITVDGQTLMFTRQTFSYNDSHFSNQAQEDFYISTWGDNKWNTALNAGSPLNTPSNEGAQTLASSGNYMFFTACDRPGAVGSCDIYFSVYNDGRWTQPYNLNSPVNTPMWESQPSVSSDGKVLYFSSSRPGGFGGKDIWYSILDSSSRWKSPVNMGMDVNSEGDEMSPFIHFDGRTLYFSSDGREGMGGFDLFMTRMNKDSVWSKPENLGYPINTYNDEMGLVIESNGKRAYFSTVREKSKGKDIYYFDLDESIRPDPVSYLKGKVIDKVTGAMIKADYELINLSSNQVTIKSTTDSRGSFLVCLPSGNNYGINVRKPGYLFHSENFLFEGIHTIAEPYIKKIVLSPIKIGEKMLLANIFYATDSWEIKEESSAELSNLADLIIDNKNVVMEIGGHTDSTGSDDHNKILSEKRALSVVSYLISRGVEKERLKSRGYGNSLPIGDNDSAEGRQLNRRTEAKVLDIKK